MESELISDEQEEDNNFCKTILEKFEWTKKRKSRNL